MEWVRKNKTKELIDSWQKYPILHNTKLEAFKDRDKKEALQKIAEEIEVAGKYM